MGLETRLEEPQEEPEEGRQRLEKVEKFPEQQSQVMLRGDVSSAGCS